MDATGSSSLLGPQYHAEGGLTDGCYALYNNSDVGQVDHVLTQIQVGSWRRRIRRPRKERERGYCMLRLGCRPMHPSPRPRLACQWLNDGSTNQLISESCSLGVTHSTDMFLALHTWSYSPAGGTSHSSCSPLLHTCMQDPHAGPRQPPHAPPMQATHTKESTERMLLVAYMHETSSPLVKAYAIAASYPYLTNSPAIMDAVIQRLERHVRITG